MNSNLNKEAKIFNRYGEEQVLRKTRKGWTVKRENTTPIIKMNRVISSYIGKRVKQFRTKKGLTMQQLGIFAGMIGDPKHRIWAIENNTRGEGIRFGSLYALAVALDCEVYELLPKKKEVIELAKFSIATPVLGEAEQI